MYTYHEELDTLVLVGVRFQILDNGDVAPYWLAHGINLSPATERYNQYTPESPMSINVFYGFMVFFMIVAWAGRRTFSCSPPPRPVLSSSHPPPSRSPPSSRRTGND